MTPPLAQETGKRTWARIGRPASLTKGQQMWMDRIAKKDLTGPEIPLEQFLELRNEGLVENPRSAQKYREDCVEAVGLGQKVDK